MERQEVTGDDDEDDKTWRDTRLWVLQPGAQHQEEAREGNISKDECRRQHDGQPKKEHFRVFFLECGCWLLSVLFFIVLLCVVRREEQKENRESDNPLFLISHKHSV